MLFLVQMNLLSKEKKYHFTYQTKNLINGKTYIGVHSTNNVYDSYLGSGDKLFYSIKKYGRHNFKREILDFFDTKEEALAEEEFLVTKEYVALRDNYNINLGGFMPPSFLGKKLSPEHRQKLITSKIGYVTSEETRRRIGEASKGRPCSQETRKKISSITKGKINLGPKSPEHLAKLRESWKHKPPVSAETRAKQSLRQKGKKMPEGNGYKIWEKRRLSIKPMWIVVYSHVGNVKIGMFPTIKEASISVGTSIAAITKLLNGTTKKHNKFRIIKGLA
jgi:group I intron endonuclease